MHCYMPKLVQCAIDFVEELGIINCFTKFSSSSILPAEGLCNVAICVLPFTDCFGI
jgi:hypothetical protein